MAKVFGRATIKANGKLLDSVKGASLDMGGPKRTSKMTSRGRAGSLEEQMPGKVECSIPLTASISLKELQDLADVTVLFQTDVGKLYTIAHADCIDPPTVDDQNGEVKLVFEGEAALETTASG